MTDRLTRLFHEAAEHAAPEPIDLWPAIDARLRPAPVPARRWKGALTLAAALLVILAAVLVLVSVGDPDNSLHVAGLQQAITPTVSPEASSTGVSPVDAVRSPRAALCESYPQYCVPLIGGGTADSPLALVEVPAPERAAYPGVVRGLTADGVPFIGNPAAPVRFEVVQDFACPHCADYHHDDIQRFIQDYVLTGKAVLQMRLIARVGGENSAAAAQAALCAGEQGAFWEMTDALFALSRDQGIEALTDSNIRETATRLELDPARLAACRESGRMQSILDDNLRTTYEQVITDVPAVLINDGQSSNWQAVERTYDALASFTEAFDATPGLSMPNPVYITDNNTTNGVFTYSGELTNNQPRADFTLIDGISELYDELDAAEGWMLLTVEGEFFTPDLYVAQIANGWGDGGLLNSYRTSDGALLFHWLNKTTPGDQSLYHQVYYNFVVEGSRPTLLGNYSLMLRPLKGLIDLSGSSREVTISGGEPHVIRFTTPETQQLRLTVEVTQALSPEQALSSAYTLIPDFALILPHGQTLTTFNPGQTQRLVLDFTAPPQDQSYLVISPLDSCQPFPAAPSPNSTITRAPCPDEESEIGLRFTIEPVDGAAANTPATPTPLKGTILLPPGTVAVSLPSGSYSLDYGDPEDFVGQYVDLILSLIVIDLDDESANGESQTIPGFVQITPGEEKVEIVTIPQAGQDIGTLTETVFANALVVSVGPYLSSFSNESPALSWATGQEEWGAITLAVSPPDALALEWAVAAQLPIRIDPAAEPPVVAMAYEPKASDEFGLRAGDTVDIILAANQIRFDGPSVQGHVLPAGDTDSPRLTLHGVKVASLQVGVFNLELPPLEAAILQWAIDENIPLKFVVSEE